MQLQHYFPPTKNEEKKRNKKEEEEEKKEKKGEQLGTPHTHTRCDRHVVQCVRAVSSAQCACVRTPGGVPVSSARYTRTMHPHGVAM